MRKHLIALALFALALILTVVIAGCGNSSSGPRDTVVSFTTALTKSNFYDACSYIDAGTLADNGHTVNAVASVTYTGQRACALIFAANVGGAVGAGAIISNGFVVAAEPLTAAQAKKAGREIPKNGYVYKASYVADQFDPFTGGVEHVPSTVYISVQRDSSGVWRVVGIS